MEETDNEYVRRILTEIGHHLFRYEPMTGDIFGKYPDKNDEMLKSYFGRGGLTSFITQRAGKRLYTEVKNKAGNVYVCFSVGFKLRRMTIKNHQLAWFLTYSEWAKEIDHIDGDGLNNRLNNLRAVTRTENSRNHRKAKNNTSGFNGVSWIERLKKWRAYSFDRSLGEKGKQIYLGTYDNLFDACCARKSYDLKNGYTERHGI